MNERRLLYKKKSTTHYFTASSLIRHNLTKLNTQNYPHKYSLILYNKFKLKREKSHSLSRSRWWPYRFDQQEMKIFILFFSHIFISFTACGIVLFIAADKRKSFSKEDYCFHSWMEEEIVFHSLFFIFYCLSLGKCSILW